MNPYVLIVIAQMLSKGRVCKEELYQLSNYIPDAINLLSTVMKMDAQQLFEKMTKGEVKTNDIIVPFLTSINDKYENL